MMGDSSQDQATADRVGGRFVGPGVLGGA